MLLACVTLGACTAPESAPTGIAPSADPVDAKQSSNPYTVLELGTVGGLRSSLGMDVNDQGVVAGYSIDDTAVRGFLLLGGQLVPLTQSSDSRATGVSNGDPMYVVGSLTESGVTRYARWTVSGGVIGAPVLAPVQGGTWKVNDLGDGVGNSYIWRLDNSVVQVPLPQDYQYLYGQNIDDAGISIFNASGSPTTAERAFVRLANGAMVRLDPPAGRESYLTRAGGLNEPDADGNVLVAGTIQLDAFTRYAARWAVNVATEQVVVWVDTALPGFATDVSTAGTLVGAAGRRADSDAYAWSPSGSKVKLPAPRGGQDVAALAVSDNGRYATGHYTGRQGQRALLWTGTEP